MASARRFRIKGVLGKGGFGVVYRATLEEQGFQTEVAIKLMKSDELPPHMLSRFRDEARILGLIRDRAVVRVFPPAVLDGQPALIMEYVDGKSTSELLKANKGPLPQRVVTELIAEVARSLHDVYHQAGPDGSPLHLVHRDIKPANLQITPTGTVKVLDFGIAKAAYEGRESETTVHLFGTPQYMAPERLLGECGPASDVYSLGCVYRRLMFGDRPVGGGQFRPSSVRPKQTRMLEEAERLVNSMLDIEPEKRPTAGEVERDALDLAARMGGPSLREWARQNAITQPPTADALAGAVLSEATVLDPVVDREPTLNTIRAITEVQGAKYAVGMAAAGAGLFLLALLLGGVGLGMWWNSDKEIEGSVTVHTPPPATPVPSPAAPPSIEPIPTLQPPEPEVVEPEPVPMPSEPVSSHPKPSAPVRTPTPAPAVQPAPSPSEVTAPIEARPAPTPPAPEPIAPAAPQVTVQSNGAVVVFRDRNNQPVQVKDLTAGTYTVWVAFDPKHPSEASRQPPLVLATGDVVNIRCVPSARRCVHTRK